MPIQLLYEAAKYGSFRGLSLDYDRRPVPDVDFEAPNAPGETLKMQLWGNEAGEVLRVLTEVPSLAPNTALSKVKVKYWLSGERDGEFAVDDIKYNGKITSRGTSFQSHISLVSDLYRRYAAVVRHIEQQYSIGHQVEENRLQITGEPINLILTRPIENLKVFCESLFSCTDPFRLWGVPTRLSDDFWRVCAVDLHVGSRISLEIAPDFIRIYLPVGSCGNTVLRIFTNLQHHYDALIEARNGNDERIFEF